MSEADDAGYPGEDGVQQAAYFARHGGKHEKEVDAEVALLGAGPRQCARLKRIHGNIGRDQGVCCIAIVSRPVAMALVPDCYF